MLFGIASGVNIVAVGLAGFWVRFWWFRLNCGQCYALLGLEKFHAPRPLPKQKNRNVPHQEFIPLGGKQGNKSRTSEFAPNEPRWSGDLWLVLNDGHKVVLGPPLDDNLCTSEHQNRNILGPSSTLAPDLVPSVPFARPLS